jgi:hypothetical protein
MTVTEFRDIVRSDRPSLIEELQQVTGRRGVEERDAWNASLPELAESLSDPALGPLHLHFGRGGYLALEYQLPAAASWCDVVLLGSFRGRPSAVIVELKHWITRADRPGPVEGLMERAGHIVLHPSDQVRGYTEYCRRFHSAVQDHRADVKGCVLFTRDYFVENYRDPPNDRLTGEYPMFTRAPNVMREAWPEYFSARFDAADEKFAREFVAGRYRQERGFVRQVGAQILDPKGSPFELLDHQRRAFAMVRAEIETNVFAGGRPAKQVIIVEGPPGSGKSVLAAKIWASLVTDERLPEGNAVLVTTSTAQTSNWFQLFQNAGHDHAAGGLVKRAGSYVPISTQELGRLRRRHGRGFAGDPSAWRENVNVLRNRGVPFRDGGLDNQYLVSVVDEAHALINSEHPEGRGQFGFVTTLGPLAWHIIRCSTVSIFLLDSEQGFRDRENTTIGDIRLWAGELGARTPDSISLAGTQFRCAGSVEFIAWVDGLLEGRPAKDLAELANVWQAVFDVRIFGTPQDLTDALRAKASTGEKVRIVASYSRPWITSSSVRPHELPPEQRDFHIEYRDGAGKRQFWSRVWNFIPQQGSNYTWFIQAPPGSPMAADPLCEVGCPYVVRGFDFDYVGLLWLGDLIWRSGRWKPVVDQVHDTGLDRSVGAARKETSDGIAHERLRRALAQAYRILLTRGMSGCYFWVEDEETREYVRDAMGGVVGEPRGADAS